MPEDFSEVEPILRRASRKPTVVSLDICLAQKILQRGLQSRLTKILGAGHCNSAILEVCNHVRLRFSASAQPRQLQHGFGSDHRPTSPL